MRNAPAMLVACLLGSACRQPEEEKGIDDSASSSTSGVGIDRDNDGYNEGPDCDDFDDAINPAAVEICDGVDQDCNGYIDENLDTSTWYADGDGDGFGVDDQTVVDCGQPDGTVRVAGDCDDEVATRYPEADELCNGVDDDCDGGIDEGLSGEVASYADEDADGYGDADAVTMACAPIVDGHASNGEDCDDTDDDVNPSSSEVCNGLDDDCDGATDDASALDATEWYADLDGDGFGDEWEVARSCEAPSGYVADGTDCDDTDGLAWPGASERCDGSDDDCDGEDDEDDAIDPAVWIEDGDYDGYGADDGLSAVACVVPYGYAGSADDCEDTNAAVHPGATELPNGQDDDCDGMADDGVPGPGDTGDPTLSGCSADEADCASGLSFNGLDDDCDGNPDDDCDVDNDEDGQSEPEGDCDDEDEDVYYSHKKGFGNFGSWISDFGADDDTTLTLMGDVSGDGMEDAVVVSTSGVINVAVATATDPSTTVFGTAFVEASEVWWPPYGSGTAFTVSQYYAASPTRLCSSDTLVTPWVAYSFINTWYSATTEIETAATFTGLADVDSDGDDDLVLYVGDLDWTDTRCSNGCQNGCDTAAGALASSCPAGYEGGWYVYRSTGTSFSSPSLWLNGEDDYDGYNADEFHLGDVNGDGAADVLAYFRADGNAVGCPGGCLPDTDYDGDLTDEECGLESDGRWAVGISTGSSFGEMIEHHANFGCSLTGTGACNVDWRGVADVNADGMYDLVAADLDTDTWQVALSSGGAFGTGTGWRSTGEVLYPTYELYDGDGNGAIVLSDSDGDGEYDPDDGPDIHYAIKLADVNGDLASDIVLVSYDSGVAAHVWRVAIAGSSVFSGELNASSSADVWGNSTTSLVFSRFFAGNVNETDEVEAGAKTLADAIVYNEGTWYVAGAIGQECSSEPDL